VVLPISISCGESCLLVSWCAGGRCDMVGSDEDHSRSGRHDAEDQRWSSTCRVLGGRTIKRSGDAVCGLHRARGEEEREFPGLATKPRLMVCQWFGLKTTGTGFPVWASKPLGRVSQFGPQNHWDGLEI
jgi:hypothetical protein